MSTGYRRGYRRSYAPTVGRVTKPNRRPGECKTCGEEIPAYGGQLYRCADDTWAVVHWPQSKPGPASMWDRAPITGGCPDVTDSENARMLAAGFIDAPATPERERIASRAAAGQAGNAANAPRQSDSPREASRHAGSKYAYTSSGARVTMSSRRCEDAPCCGCCD